MQALKLGKAISATTLHGKQPLCAFCCRHHLRLREATVSRGSS